MQEAFEGMEKEGKGKGALNAERSTRKHQREAEANAAAGISEEAGDGGVAEGKATCRVNIAKTLNPC